VGLSVIGEGEGFDSEQAVSKRQLTIPTAQQAIARGFMATESLRNAQAASYPRGIISARRKNAARIFDIPPRPNLLTDAESGNRVRAEFAKRHVADFAVGGVENLNLSLAFLRR
jgi:hypothetical protein